VPLGFSLLWLLPFLTITLLFYLSNREFMTEYTRFLPEIEMGIALLIGYWLSRIVSWQGKKIFNSQFSILNFSTLLILFASLLYSLYSLSFRQRLFVPHPNITNTLEYQTAKLLEREVVNGQRVFLSGSTAFWLNEFAPDIWQVRGGIDQASTNPSWARAVYQVRTSPDFVNSLLWLKVLRVNYLVVHDQNSREYYHDFAYPEKFEGKVRNVFDNGQGDRIYKVDTNMASVASQEGFKSLSDERPARKDDLLERYVEWTGQYLSVEVKKPAGDSGLLINATLDRDQLIAVGITYDRGWQAVGPDGNKLTTRSDPMGNLVIFPKGEGRQEFRLEFHEGMDLWFGIGLSLATLGFVLFLLPKKLPIILERAQGGWEEEEG